MSSDTNIFGALIICSIALYILALGFGMIIAQQRGVAYVNRIARRVAAWPVEMAGRGLVALAGFIRG